MCSASVVTDGADSRSLAVTAAHCVYENEGAGEFATHWMYNPNNRLFKLTYKLDCDMTGGASGGPWFSPFTDTAWSVAITASRWLGQQHEVWSDRQPPRPDAVPQTSCDFRCREGSRSSPQIATIAPIINKNGTAEET